MSNNRETQISEFISPWETINFQELDYSIIFYKKHTLDSLLMPIQTATDKNWSRTKKIVIDFLWKEFVKANYRDLDKIRKSVNQNPEQGENEAEDLIVRRINTYHSTHQYLTLTLKIGYELFVSSSIDQFIDETYSKLVVNL